MLGAIILMMFFLTLAVSAYMVVRLLEPIWDEHPRLGGACRGGAVILIGLSLILSGYIGGVTVYEAAQNPMPQFNLPAR